MEDFSDLVKAVATALCIMIFMIFFVFTFMSWVAPPYGSNPNPTLVEVLRNEYHWFVSLTHRIY